MTVLLAAIPAMDRAFVETEWSASCAVAQMRDRDIKWLRDDRFAFVDKTSAVLSLGYDAARKLSDAESRARCVAAIKREKRRAATWRGRDDWRWHWAVVLIAVIDERAGDAAREAERAA